MSINSPAGILIALVIIMLVTRSKPVVSFKKGDKLFHLGYSPMGDFKTLVLLAVMVAFFGQSEVRLPSIDLVTKLWPHSLSTNHQQLPAERSGPVTAQQTAPATPTATTAPEIAQPEPPPTASVSVSADTGDEESRQNITPGQRRRWGPSGEPDGEPIL